MNLTSTTIELVDTGENYMAVNDHTTWVPTVIRYRIIPRRRNGGNFRSFVNV